MGDYIPAGPSPEKVFLLQRQHEEERLIVALHFADLSQRFRLPCDVQDVPICLSIEGGREGKIVGMRLELAPREGVVVEYPAVLWF